MYKLCVKFPKNQYTEQLLAKENVSGNFNWVRVNFSNKFCLLKISHVLKPETSKRDEQNETSKTNETTETTKTKQPKRNEQNETSKTNETTETTKMKQPKRNDQNETIKTKQPKRNDQNETNERIILRIFLK